MTRWIGSNGDVKTTGDVDSTGTSFNERCKKNERNLDDMIHYLEYRKNSGYAAARVDEEQEEYWALLVRHLLMEKVIDNYYPIITHGRVLGARFTCCKCGTIGSMEFVYSDFKVGNQDEYEITQYCHCRISELRKNDIIEYLEYIIQRWCEVEKVKTVKQEMEKEWRNLNIMEGNEIVSQLQRENEK